MTEQTPQQHQPVAHQTHTAYATTHTPLSPPSARPQSGPHPEEIYPLGTTEQRAPQHSSEEKQLLFVLSVALVAAIVLVPITAVLADSPLINVLLGLSPLLVTIILDIVATNHHYKPVVFWITLAVVNILALAALYLLNLGLSTPINIASSVSVCVILGVIVTIVCMLATPKETIRHVAQTTQHGKGHVVPFKKEKLSEYVQSIEDKCKGINFAIGRTYRSSNGATIKMRERLRIPSEWYNEFHGIRGEDTDTQAGNAKVLVRKIRDRLALYAMREKEVFSPHELSNLKHMVRHKDGEDTIIHILKTNDRDPVEHYYVSAVEFCDRILEELEQK